MLAGGQGLFPQGGPGTGALNAGGARVPEAPPGASAMSVGSGNAAQDYRGNWAKVAGLDDDASATAGAGEANGQQGRTGATGVRQTAQTAAAAIAPATGNPAGVKMLVSTMDDRLADMQRQIDTTKAQNKLLAARLRQMAMAYRSMGGGMPGGGAMGAARGAMGGFGGMPSMGGGGFGGGGGIPGMSALSGLPAAFAGLRGSGRGRPGDELNTSAPGSGGPAAQRAVAFARAQIGKPYVWGAAGPNAFDCSGLTMEAYRAAGISLPHHTYEQMRVGAPVSRNNIEAGDRIYCNFSGPGRPEHTMLAISPTMAIEAPTPGQRVHITSIPLGRIEVRRGG
ncbi:MAG: NlpC/P60 family protein [Mycobacterium sp.]|nr:MAG: NlpC/P60 family protein [Mycobacterium sp.]